MSRLLSNQRYKEPEQIRAFYTCRRDRPAASIR
jgi:hypothetical protein